MHEEVIMIIIITTHSLLKWAFPSDFPLFLLKAAVLVVLNLSYPSAQWNLFFWKQKNIIIKYNKRKKLYFILKSQSDLGWFKFFLPLINFHMVNINLYIKSGYIWFLYRFRGKKSYFCLKFSKLDPVFLSIWDEKYCPNILQDQPLIY